MDELDLNVIEKRLEQAIAPLDSIQFHHHVNMRRDIQTLLIEVRRLRQVIATVEETYLETLCETQRERDEALAQVADLEVRLLSVAEIV